MENQFDHVNKKVDASVDETKRLYDKTLVALNSDCMDDVLSISFEKASIDDIPKITEFIEGELEKADCPMKFVIQINIAIDEIYSNIVRYGYTKGAGPATVSISIIDNPKEAIINFIDEGVHYNPLEKADPDITLSAEERNIGGLGIFMVKKTMDEVSYKFEGNKNVLTIIKKF